jgi:Na+/H+ antiporter NhaD/arsenite permease-like protein
MIAHNTRFIFVFCILFWVYSKKFLQKKDEPKTQGRELTTLETIAWFAIGFSALWILLFVAIKGLFGNPAVMLPLGIIGLAIRSLFFAKDLAAYKTPASATN